MVFSGKRNEIRLQHTGERSNTSACAVRFKRLSGSASGGSAGVCDESTEGQDKNPRETDNAGSQLPPPIDDVASAPDGQQTRQGRRYPGDQDDVAQDTDRLWRAGCRCCRYQDETKGDSDRSDEVEHARRDGVLGDPDEAGRHEDAGTADGDDTKADHECKVFQNVLFALPSNNLMVSITVTCPRPYIPVSGQPDEVIFTQTPDTRSQDGHKPRLKTAYFFR